MTIPGELRGMLSTDRYSRYLSHPMEAENEAIIDLLIREERESRVLVSEEQRLAMNKRQHEYQQTIKSGVITEEQAKHNHNEWRKRAEKSGQPYITYQQFITTDFTK